MSVAQGSERPVFWPEFLDARILLVDDDADAVLLHSRALTRAGCRNVITADNPSEALMLYHRHHPDLVVMDLNLPGADGLNLMERMRGDTSAEWTTPILMVTGDESSQTRWKALERGVADFLAKSADTTELVLRVRNLLRMNGLSREIELQRQSLAETVTVRTSELHEARLEVLERLALAAEYRDDATGEHTRRVGRLSACLADRIGMEQEYVAMIGAAALLHDLGKIGISDAILLKPSSLTPEEMARIRQHPEIGARILDGCTAPLLRMAREIALTHHERWDGSGYPNGIKRNEIPLSGRIVAVADAYDAITHERPYKPAQTRGDALRAILSERGKQFDPSVVDALFELPESGGFACVTA